MTADRESKRGFLSLVRRRWWVAYLVLVVASNLWPRADEPPPKQLSVTVSAMSDAGPVAGREMRVAYWEWLPPGQHAHGQDARATPVILIHGSPGSGGDFDQMGAFVAGAPTSREGGVESQGRGDAMSVARRVIAPDLPGFGESERDPPRGGMSILGHAHTVLALMDRLGIARAHVLGWSLGGGVALHMADRAPDRLASVTLMASVGAQEDEGSGSYWFEHARYGVGWLLADGIRLGVPHFGLLDQATDFGRASMQNFWETDQRPLRAIMQRLTVPTLVLAGRHDFLVRDWAAEREFKVIPTARLVMLDASHFMPFLQPREASEHLLAFFQRHDDPGARPLRQVADLSPRRAPLLGAVGSVYTEALLATPWWALAAATALLVWWRDRLGLALVALIVASGRLDYGVALAGIIGAQVTVGVAEWRRGRARRRERWARPVVGSGINAHGLREWDRRLREHPLATTIGGRFVPGAFEAAMQAWGRLGGVRPVAAIGTAAAIALRPVLWLILAGIIYALAAGRATEWFGAPGWLIAAVLTASLPGALELLLTRSGRRMLRMRIGRARRREFWPAAMMYLPLVPHFARLALRHRGPLTFTACNPGIPSGGGIIGESKKAIMDAITDDAVLASELVPAGESADRRSQRALHALSHRPELGGVPVILKPDSGYRGFAVKLARSEDDIRSYFDRMTAPAIVQRYHPGPHECGILWVRCPDRGFENNGQLGSPTPKHGGWGPLHGSIFSICRKDFPVIEGDGRRSIEQLIQEHPRFRYQAAVFLERWAAERWRVLAAGERLRLAEAGNHCQGTLFRDGADLITPALEARIDAVARRFALSAADRGLGGLDIGRFDVRYESDEALRDGRGIGIIELNGTTGESTNIYDPERSALWAYGVLARQWTLMYELGARRRAMGTPVVTVRELAGHARRHFATRAGSALAD